MFSVGRCAQIAMAASDQIYYVGRQTAVEILAIRSAQCYTISEKYEPRLWWYLFGILLFIFLAILGYCCVIASRQGAFLRKFGLRQTLRFNRLPLLFLKILYKEF